MMSYLQPKRAINRKFCIRNAFIDILTHAKFNFNQLMLTLIFGIRASELTPWAWRTTEKAGPDRVKISNINQFMCQVKSLRWYAT